MAPIKPNQNSMMPHFSLNRISTRSKSTLPCHNSKEALEATRTKRKADCSPPKENKSIKRLAFGEKNINLLENIKKAKKTITVKKVTTQKKTVASVKTVNKISQKENLECLRAPALKVVTRQSKPTVSNQTAVKSKEVLKELNKINKRLSNEFEKTDDSLYYTASEDGSSNESTYCSAKKQHNLRSSSNSTVEIPLIQEVQQNAKQNVEKREENISNLSKQIKLKLNIGNHEVPDNVEDFDKENWDDCFQVSDYAMDIFNYLNEKETKFKIPDYLDRQICLTRWMRSLLVDWMVEIQESFELNHETLYLGVKLVDTYLSRMTIGKETLQLVGAAAMLVSCKFDERIPPMIDDFLYVCDGAYSKRELIRMEINLLKVCGFELGIPISYRFLRRYARCARIKMPVLTLARFVLEYSLMNYDTVTIRDSKLASAALYIAIKMKDVSGWTETLEFYTGYRLEDFKDVVLLLNNYINQPPNPKLMTVRNKYSHKIFFEVAKVPLLANNQLFT
ncbi:G2/mitotic-specific cyclin-B3 isoform X1 [Diorhabda carinulata]|uniref:G2/mitotic-specific cyclin-B3 isoform X1 n=1 Tax=Diorhabda carinulata TaxID=1163345 RepID=UPI0025A1D1B5|nr:G2/mitotic-specific cyclin-B3 isoform X1 [Diorhabda carinulata]